MFDHQYKYERYFEAGLSGGETRWATREEIQNSCEHIDLNNMSFPRGGIPILSDGKKYIYRWKR